MTTPATRTYACGHTDTDRCGTCGQCCHCTSQTATDCRQQQLLAEITRRCGEWTTEDVRRLHVRLGIPAPKRATARHDLMDLAAAGHLDRHDRLGVHNNLGRRHYTLRRTA